MFVNDSTCQNSLIQSYSFKDLKHLESDKKFKQKNTTTISNISKSNLKSLYSSRIHLTCINNDYKSNISTPLSPIDSKYYKTKTTCNKQPHYENNVNLTTQVSKSNLTISTECTCANCLNCMNCLNCNNCIFTLNCIKCQFVLHNSFDESIRCCNQ